MDNRRKQRWDNYGRSQRKKPPRGSWQPKVPSWEKRFCKVIGQLDWETLLHMKKFIHLYDDVIKWNDSAGEEAFLNAKKRFWSEINGFACDIPLPDRDLYIDKINWDSQITDQDQLFSEPDRESLVGDYKDHDPVVIFGDSLVSGQEYSSTGWGDYEEGSNLPLNNYCSLNDQGQNRCNPINYHKNANAWIGHCSNSCSGYNKPFENGWNNNISWSYVGNGFDYSRPNYGYMRADQDNSADVRYLSNNNNKYFRAQGNEYYREDWMPKNDERRGKASFDSCKSRGYSTVVKAGQTWN